jgi:hypothetical protein
MDDTTETPRTGVDSGMEGENGNFNGIPAQAPANAGIEAREPEAAAQDYGNRYHHEARLHEVPLQEFAPPVEPPPARAAAVPDTRPPIPAAPVTAIASALAGMQAGMLGVLCMLAWLGIDSSWDRRGFWRDQNLFASFFYGDAAIHEGFTSKTLSGLALYLAIYSILGFIFGYLMRNQLRSFRRLLLAEIFALGWFYLSFHILWKTAMPLAYLLYADQPMTVGHVIFGACLSSFPGFLPHGRPQPIAAFAESKAAFMEPQAVSSSPAESTTVPALSEAQIEAAQPQPAEPAQPESGHSTSGEPHAGGPQANSGAGA